MKILLLGGTAFFGKSIARRLVDAGHDLGIFTRGNVVPQDLPPHTALKGDRNSASDLKRAAQAAKWDVVIDNIAYTANDIRLALKTFPGVKRYVFTSSVSAYRYIPGKLPEPFSEKIADFDYTPAEEDLTNVHWKYARGKLEAERALREQKEIPWTTVRPPVVYGPDDITDRGFFYLIRLQKGGPILLADGGKNRFRLVYSEDVATSYVQILQTDKTIGGTYHVAQEEVITLKQFVEYSAKVLAVKCDVVSVPADRMNSFAGDYASMTNFVPDITAAKKDFAFRPTPFETFAKDTALWFKTHWRGDQSKLLATRKDELALAASYLAYEKLR